MAESAADQTATTNITLDTIHDLVIAAYKGLESKDREQDDNMAAAESHIFLDNLKERLTKNDVTLERLFAGDNVGKTKAKKIMGKMALVITDGTLHRGDSAADRCT